MLIVCDCWAWCGQCVCHIESPATKPQLYGQLIHDRGSEHKQRAKDSYKLSLNKLIQYMLLGKLDRYRQKNEPRSHSYTHTIINWKLIKDLSVRHEP